MPMYTTYKRRSMIAEMVRGLEVGSAEAEAQINSVDWDDYWPTATHDEAGRLVYDSGIIHANEQGGYVNCCDRAMVPVSECVSRYGKYIRRRQSITNAKPREGAGTTVYVLVTNNGPCSPYPERPELELDGCAIMVEVFGTRAEAEQQMSMAEAACYVGFQGAIFERQVQL